MRRFQLSMLLLTCIGVFFAYTSVMARSQPLPRLTIQTESNDAHSFVVKIAKTPEQQAKGLMFRESMLKNHGMLFINKSPTEMTMWMKNTLIPLDMLFIGKHNIITHIHHNAQPHSLEYISSEGEVSAVLEINGGRAETLNIMKGSKVIYDIP